MRNRALSVAAFLVAAFAAPIALAGFRCDTDLVGRGMTPFEVVERCGEPVYEYGFVDVRYPGLFVQVDEWTYDGGDNRFRRLLRFENGRLTRIETRAKPGGPQLEDSPDVPQTPSGIYRRW